MSKPVCLIILLIFGVYFAKAQNKESCLQKLAKVIDIYQNPEKVIYQRINLREELEALENCLKNDKQSFTKEQVIEGYKYLTILYIYRENDDKRSIESMKYFIKKKLRNNPLYDPKDPKENPENRLPRFHKLYNEMQHLPLFFLGFKGGYTATQIQSDQVFRADANNASLTNAKYESQFGFVVGALAEFQLIKPYKLTLQTEVNFLQSSFEFTDRLISFENLRFSETQNRLHVPITFRYYFQRKPSNLRNKKFHEGESIKNRFQPFLEVGGAIDYLISSEAEVSRLDQLLNAEGLPVGQREEKRANIEVTEQRNQIAASFILGLGLRVRHFLSAGGDLSLSARYHRSFQSIVDESERLSNRDLLFDFAYIDDTFSMHHLSLNISYKIPWPFNQPKYLKRKRYYGIKWN